MGELADAGITDSGRLAQRRRYTVVGFLLLLAGAAALGGAVLLAPTHGGGWPLFIPLALLIGSILSFIVMSAHTPLSNEGVRRAQQWRAYKKHLSDPAGDRVALGLERTRRSADPAVCRGAGTGVRLGEVHEEVEGPDTHVVPRRLARGRGNRLLGVHRDRRVGRPRRRGRRRCSAAAALRAAARRGRVKKW